MFKIGDFSRLSQVSVKALRYYDQIDLLKPAHIDPFTSYRYYAAEQLPRLNRILALKDLGLSLDEIAGALAADLSPEQLGEMLRRKRAEIARQVAEEQARLARVEARLQQIEREGAVPEYEVVIKPVAPQRMIGIRTTVPDYEAIEPLFYELAGHFIEHNAPAVPGAGSVTVFYDEEYCERDADVLCAAPLAGPLPENERVRLVDLPGIAQAASVIYRGAYTGVSAAYNALLHWIAANAYRIDGPNRMVYLQGPESDCDPAGYITEVQFPVVRA